MRYSVTVKPNSKKGPLVCVDETDSSILTVFLRQKPVEGAANTALIEILAQYFHVAKTRIVIKNGVHSRQKLIEII